MSQGTVIVGGLTYTIASLHIRGGQLEITAVRHGPVPEMVNEPAAVFGEDGQGFCQGPDQGGASITHREVERHEMAMITLKLRMTEVTAA